MSGGQRWAILGGGMLGLTLALRLAARGRPVSVYEAADGWGGLAAAQPLGGIVCDRFYHVILASDLHLRRLLADLGLEQEIRWATTRTGFYTNGRLYPMDSAWDYLRLPAASPFGKLRLAATLLDLYRRRRPGMLDSIGIESYLRRVSGGPVFESIWLPLLKAKLGNHYAQVSAAFIWAVVQRLLAARRAGLSQERFGYLPGGYGRILERLMKTLAAAGVPLSLERRVEGVWLAPDNRLRVRFQDDHQHLFDRVIATLPSPVVAAVCPDLEAGERERLACVGYQGVVCLRLLLKRPLSGYYLTYITDPGLPVTAVVEMSNLTGAAPFGGRSLVYLPKYVDDADPLAAASDREIFDGFLAGLGRMYPGLDGGDIVDWSVARARYVLPLPVPGYARWLAPMRTSLPGLHVVNSSYIVNGTLNVNETVALAEEYARTC